VVLDVAALVDPPGADRIEAHPGVAARSARVVEPDRLVRRVELDLEERDAHVVAPAGDVDLAADAHAVLTSPALPGSGSAVGASAPSQPGRPSSRVVLPATVAPPARARAGRGGADRGDPARRPGYNGPHDHGGVPAHRHERVRPPDGRRARSGAAGPLPGRG